MNKNTTVMKNIRVLFILVILVGIASSCSKWSKKMEVIRDCTGVYLKLDSKEYKVCNESKLDNVATGEKIKVDYDVLTECFGLIEQPVCMMYHEYEDLIEVVRIK